MAIFLERVDSAPLVNEKFTFPMMQWFSNIVDSLNETIAQVEGRINTIVVPGYTTTQITAMEPDADNGTLWFNTTLGKLQFKVSAGVIETVTST